MIDGIERTICTGCKMCADICPRAAISYEADKKGFWYPLVDYQKCDRCNLCIKSCPALTGFNSKKQDPDVYAAWSTDDEIRLRSTSGGMYSALARMYICEGKYISGCQYTGDQKAAMHVITDSASGLETIIGSKYIQSDTAGIYKEIKGLLDIGSELLFCGAPCQSAALQNYLNKSYSNLITIDFICRGVTSPRIYSEYISELEEKFDSKAVSVHAKNKRKGWQSLGICIKFENGKEYFRVGKDDLWVRGYVEENLYTRPSCFNCKYRNLPRVSDISLGDFWGIQNVSKADHFKGISLVLINSDKGGDLFNKVKSEIFFEDRSLDEAINGNPSILTNSCNCSKSDIFFRQLDSMNVSESIEKCLESKDTGSGEVLKKIKSTFSYIDPIKFIYYNFFCKSIIREKGCYLITYKNSIINLEKSSRVYIKGGSIHLGASKLRGSKAETYLRMGENSKWIVKGGAELFHSTQIDILEDAVLETGYFSANCGTMIVCSKKITLGENIMMGRNIIIYDSDHHQIVDRNGNMINYDEEVVIGDNVWLTSNVTVLRGVTIGEGSIITAQTVIKKDLPPYSLVGGGSSAKVIMINKATSWNRKTTHKRPSDSE